MNLNILEKKQDSCVENKVACIFLTGFLQAGENVQDRRKK